MNDTRHTPGPWLIEPKAARGLRLHDRHGQFIALACKRDSSNEIEEDSNALLIAAAPDMLKALQMVAQDVRSGSLPTPIQNAISAAIAKATGQP